MISKKLVAELIYNHKGNDTVLGDETSVCEGVEVEPAAGSTEVSRSLPSNSSRRAFSLHD
jgi:hypothetical protein